MCFVQRDLHRDPDKEYWPVSCALVDVASEPVLA
jgi:hypothetical protein